MKTLEEIKKEVNYWIKEYNAPNALKDSSYLSFLSRHIGEHNYPEEVEIELRDKNWQDLLNWKEICNEGLEEHNDKDLYKKHDGTTETFGEIRERIYREFGKLVKFFHWVLKRELNSFEDNWEVKGDKMGVCLKLTDLKEIKNIKSISLSANLTQYFCGLGMFNHWPPKKLLYEMDYCGAKQKIKKLMETLDRLAWEIVGFTEPNEQKKLQEVGWVRPTYDREYFIQEKFVGQGKRYKGFDPLIFKEYDICQVLIPGGYQPSDLDAQGKYLGHNPLEKSKADWDKSPSKNNNKEEEINLLLSQGQQKNNHEELSTIISKLKKHRSSYEYQRHEQEINQLETKLKNLDPEKYSSTINKLLDEQVKNSGLKEEELTEETKKMIREAKSTSEPQKVKAAEELIAKESANKKLSNIINAIKNFLAKKNKNHQEKAILIKKLTKFINSGNSYRKSAYQSQQKETDRTLAELKEQNINQSLSSLPLFLCLFIFFIGITAISTLVIKKRLKRKTRS